MAEIEKVFHIRHNQTDTGIVPAPGPAPTMSPDIICYQNHILAYQDAVESYQRYICKHFLQDTANLVYIRARNHTGKAAQGEVKAYYSPLTLLYLPKQWKPLKTATGNLTVGLFQDQRIEADPDAIVLGYEAFVMYSVEDPHLHHCMLAVSRVKGEEWLELPEKFNGDAGLWSFLRQHANIAYNNIVIETGFVNQYSEVVMIGNHNGYEERYAVRFSLEGGDTFGGCNIGRIQLLSTDIRAPFDLDVFPQGDDCTVVSPVFSLPGGMEKSIVVTYFAADRAKKVYATVKHDYIPCNSRGLIPVSNDRDNVLLSRDHTGQEILLNADTKLGDFTVVFTDREEHCIRNLKL